MVKPSVTNGLMIYGGIEKTVMVTNLEMFEKAQRRISRVISWKAMISSTKYGRKSQQLYCS